MSTLKNIAKGLKYAIKQLMPPLLWNGLRALIKYYPGRLRYLREVRRRRNLSIFDVAAVTADMPIVTRSYGFNSFYGQEEIITRLLGDIPGVYAIEHGVSYDNSIDSFTARADTIITFSETRRDYLARILASANVIAIGPYIRYAEPSVSAAQLAETHARQGKTLLVMPSHSTHYIITRFDVDSFIAEIERVRVEHDFDTVMVCTYWKDYLCGFMERFEAMGYTICSAGHIFDPQFIHRLRSIIELSDVVMANDVGTNLGYAIELNKPFYLYLQEWEVVEVGDDEVSQKATATMNHSFYDEFRAAASSAFGEYREEITPEGRAMVEHYWGRGDGVPTRPPHRA